VDTEAAKQQMRDAGISVTPNPSGGFDANGLTVVHQCWAASEETCWAMAWGYFNLEPQR
jgi:hypothetical protein